MDRAMQGRTCRWSGLVLLSSGLLLPVSCATVRAVLETVASLLYIADALA